MLLTQQSLQFWIAFLSRVRGTCSGFVQNARAAEGHHAAADPEYDVAPEHPGDSVSFVDAGSFG